MTMDTQHIRDALTQEQRAHSDRILMRALFVRGEECHDTVDGVTLHIALMEALNGLPYTFPGQVYSKQAKSVILLRFGFEDGRSHTLQEIGAQFGVTRERIRQIEAKALRQLRHPARQLRKYVVTPMDVMGDEVGSHL